jgi:CBS domain-containing protein
MAFIFGFLGLVFNPMLIFIALFVYLGASQEAAIAQMKDITERLPVSAAMKTDVRALPLDATLADAVHLLLRTAQHEFPVVDGAGTLAGVLTRDDLIAALEQGQPHAPVAQAMRTGVPEVSSRTPFEQAFELMQETRSPLVVVTRDDGRFAGLVTPEDVGELLLVHSALGGKRRWGGWLSPRIATAEGGSR